MPELTLTVTAAQWARIKTAFTGVATEAPAVPTASEMSTWIFEQIKAVVYSAERQNAENDGRVAAKALLTSEGWDS